MAENLRLWQAGPIYEHRDSDVEIENIYTILRSLEDRVGGGQPISRKVVITGVSAEVASTIAVEYQVRDLLDRPVTNERWILETWLAQSPDGPIPSLSLLGDGSVADTDTIGGEIVDISDTIIVGNKGALYSLLYVHDLPENDPDRPNRLLVPISIGVFVDTTDGKARVRFKNSSGAPLTAYVRAYLFGLMDEAGRQVNYLTSA